MADTKPMTKEEFAALSPWAKGYAAYMAGARSDQPNIPPIYHPTPEERADYEAGLQAAIIEVINGEE